MNLKDGIIKKTVAKSAKSTQVTVGTSPKYSTFVTYQDKKIISPLKIKKPADKKTMNIRTSYKKIKNIK